MAQEAIGSAMTARNWTSQNYKNSHFQQHANASLPKGRQNMSGWEYKFFVFDLDQFGEARFPDPSVIEQQLNDLGAQGWEIVSLHPSEKPTGALLKRIKA
jgi:hypothetical protein